MKIKIITFLFLFSIFNLTSCGLFRHKEEEKPKETLPKMESIKDVSDYNNKRVIIEGVYTQVDIRIKRENPAVKLTGQVAIKLPDNTNVYIYPPTSPEAVRPKKEIREMKDQQVRVVGMIFTHMPQSDLMKAKLPPTIISSPFITYIEKIELVNPLPPKKGRRK